MAKDTVEDQPATTLDNEEMRRDLRSLLEIKTVFLQIAGYESPAVAIDITPEETALSLLTQAGLEECTLFSGPDLANPYEPTDPVYERLRDGQAVYAVLPAPA